MNDDIDNIKCPESLRAKAEAQLGRPKSIPMTNEFLHELRVHQIELEMQNEALRQAQVALETSRAHYVELYDFAPVGYLTVTSEGIIVELNLTAAKLFGKERRQLINQRFAHFIVDEDKDSWYRLCLYAKQLSEKQTCVLCLHREDGTRICVQLDYQYLKADNDARPLLRITLTDITELKRVEEALQESEDRLNFAFKGSGDGMWDWNVLTGEVNYSKQWVNMLGHADGEINDDFKEWEQRVHPDDLPQAMADIQAYLSGTTAQYTNEHRLLCKDGSYKWILTRGIARTRGADGTPIRMIGTHTDITGHRKIEELLRVAAVAFESQDAIMVTDANKVILRVNKAFSRITGYSTKDAIGETPAFLGYGKEDEDFYLNVWKSVADHGYWQGELWNKRKGGEIFPSWHTITAVIGTDGNISHYISAFIDITANKQAEKVLLDARYRLENQVVATKAEMTTIKAETAEINTTLSVLLRYRETDKSNAKVALADEIETMILPLMKKIKKASAGRHQITQLLNVLENNLQQLVKTYGDTASLHAAYKQLTATEVQVASMVRQGISTKVIATILNSSVGTIEIHRKHIRKKLGLDNEATNLCSYLLSLGE